MTFLSADEKRLAEIRQRAYGGLLLTGDDALVLVRLLDAAQVRLLQAERERDDWPGKAGAEYGLRILAERRCNAAEERASVLAAVLIEVAEHRHAGPCDKVCTEHLSKIARAALSSTTPKDDK